MHKIFYILSLIVFISCKNNAVQKTTETIPSDTEMKQGSPLNGTWELSAISLEDNDFDNLYEKRKPYITFDTTKKRFSGNSSCNSFNGELKTDGNKIDFNKPIIMTKMFCEGDGEKTFMEHLKKTNAYDIQNDHLIFIMGDETVMKFIRKAEK